jgi:hypothetical protein
VQCFGYNRASASKKKKLEEEEEEEEEEGGGKRRNKIACVFGLPVELIIILSFFFFLALCFVIHSHTFLCVVL